MISFDRVLRIGLRRTQVLLLFLALLLSIPGRSAQGNEVDFETDVAPIFEDRCTYCHGEDDQESGLRLDSRASMLKGGDSGLAALVPGKPEQSFLMDAIRHLDENFSMPPDEEPLLDSEIATIEQWIKEGAKWPGQMDSETQDEEKPWSFEPIVRPSVPSLTNADESLHPMDAFVLRKLQAEGLQFSEQADPRSLLRRVSVVLTGLPPTPEATTTYLKAYERNPEKAYADLVEQLLDSPQFGERWAQHWLDVIRWAETNGSESNLYRKNAWVYRDYVIRAFNEDKPYDEFIREQLAGDSLGAGEAMGYLVAGPHVPAATVGREPSAIRQARADRLDEIMQTVGASVMGVTIGCARCHNHKFDPISIRDYYSMTAVFQDVEFGSRLPEFGPQHPIEKRRLELAEEIDTQRELLREWGGWEENWGAYRELHFSPVRTSSLRIRFKMPKVFLDEVELLGPDDQKQNWAAKSNGTSVTGFPESGFENRNPIQRLNDGEFGTMAWRAEVEANAENKPWVQFDFSAPVTLDRIRLSNNREYYYETDYLERKPRVPRYEFDIDIRTNEGEWKPWVGTWRVNKQLNNLYPSRKEIHSELQSLIEVLAEQGPRPSFVGRLVEPKQTFVLLRGSPETPRDKVPPAGPELLGGDLGLTSELSGPQRRLKFANWLVEAGHPLTSRVIVNRIWHHIFGAGIVSTTSDFGIAGAKPSHPELLDWLATEFVEPTVRSGKPWSTKDMIRMLVLSKAFRQSSRPNDVGMQVDAGSRLLWRFPPKRVEAEIIRDSILQASGKLDLSVGGVSYRIHNVKKTYAQWEVIDNHGPETWRRMLYQERMRRVDDQLFTAFDFPDCGQVRARRPISTTPLQALNLMNSPFVIEQSRLIAERATQDSQGDQAKTIQRIFQLILGRPATEGEIEACHQLLETEDASIICRALINSNEFAFLP